MKERQLGFSSLLADLPYLQADADKLVKDLNSVVTCILAFLLRCCNLVFHRCISEFNVFDCIYAP